VIGPVYWLLDKDCVWPQFSGRGKERLTFY